MKIAFDAKRAFNNVTGLGNYSKAVINSIAKLNRKNKIYLFTPHIKTTNKKNQFNPKQKNINIIQPSRLVNKHYWRMIGLNKELKNLKIDIYHGLSNEIPIGLKTKTIVTIHDLLFLKYPKLYSFIDRKTYKLKSQYACKKSDYIIAISQQTKEDIMKYFNISEAKIKVIYQSCHSDFINWEKIESSNKKPGKSISTLQKKFQELNLPNKYILNVGSFEERKNLLFLLKAIKLNKNIHLVCVGRKNTYFNKIIQFVKKHNMDNQLTFLSIEQNDLLAKVYRESRGLIYPSIDEGFGIPIIEAMYSKIPVLTSEKPIFKEVAGNNSFYFKENDVESLSTEIKKIWKDSEERNTRIALNLDYVKKFNEKSQANKILELYNTIS